jgi:structural maintenance of chromosome 4
MNKIYEKRLIVEKVGIENFKSFVGTHIIGPLDRRFNSIVGPNGSGKSNIIDALLFAFTQRAKKLRQKKVSQLIHVSRHSQKLSYAKIDIYLVEIVDEAGLTRKVSGSNICITRVADFRNKSIYFIDGVRKKFKEVS